MTSPSARPVRILFVCLGNICRSPTAEGVVRRLAAEEAPELDLHLDSAGTADYHVGSPPDPRSCRHAQRRGYSIDALRARQVTRSDFSEFDLILAMDDDNLEDLRALAPPGTTARVCLFGDFAAEGRGGAVPDPYYGTAADFDEVIDLVEAAARGLLAALGAGRGIALRDRG